MLDSTSSDYSSAATIHKPEHTFKSSSFHSDNVGRSSYKTMTNVTNRKHTVEDFESGGYLNNRSKTK